MPLLSIKLNYFNKRIYARIAFFVFISLITNFTLSHPHIITNDFEGWRRLGDNITTVSKTCYYAEKFDLPMFYTPFEYSNSFKLCQQIPLLEKSKKNQFSKMVYVNSDEDIESNIEEEDPILFVCTFLSLTPWVYSYIHENYNFGQKIRNLFTPIIPYKKIEKAPNAISIALHVRKGGGVDWPLASQQEFELKIPIMTKKKIYLHKKNPNISSEDIWPLNYLPGPGFISETKHLLLKKSFYADYIWSIKFPPDQYYIEQLKLILSNLPNKSVTIYLFTDDPNPENIVTRYKNALGTHVTFVYRTLENQHNKNVIDDLMAITQCDILIAASSSFAFAAMLLGNHSLIAMPAHAVTLPDKVIIDKVHLIELQEIPNSSKKELKSTMKSLSNFLY